MPLFSNNLVYQFKITLLGIKPSIWRRIVVPASYSFWDLHVAIQDSMGWLDCHLHAFYFRPLPTWDRIQIGIPDDDFGGEIEIWPGWEKFVYDFFTELGKTAEYEYDFGDKWEHEVTLEGILVKEENRKYPQCLDGERACPPEDCGGIPGYYNLLDTLEKEPLSDEYLNTAKWLENHHINYFPYVPKKFDPLSVKFDNPQKRWKTAFGDENLVD